MRKIGVGILSHNNPVLIDEFYAHLRPRIDKSVDFVVFDNGSDKDKIAKCTTHGISTNKFFTMGLNRMLLILRQYDYIWLCVNNFKVKTDGDPVMSMLLKCEMDGEIGIIHPSVIPITSKYDYPKMIHTSISKGYTRDHIVTDLVCMFFTKKALDANDWCFDSRFMYGWGLNYDICHEVRQKGLRIAVDFDVAVEIDKYSRYENFEDKGFRDKHAYYETALKSMYEVMIKKYGKNWRKLFNIQS